MRVVAGKYKGRVLKSPKHPGVRPTADRVKEALFNIIGARIIGASFLDLFAGSGAIGIEAISRGAACVVMADESLMSVKLVRENCRLLESPDQPRIIHLSFERTLSLLSREKAAFDLVFLDPPFEAGLLPRAIQEIWRLELLSAHAMLIAEHPRGMILDGVAPLNLIDCRTYGDISLSLFQN
jgi:16S rRNA (guanine966-N2)-methyltransferase